MSSGRFPLPNSAMVTPRTSAPGLRLETGNFTSGVQRYDAMRCGSPSISYGTNVYMGDRVSN